MLKHLLTPDGRRAAALLFMLLGGIAMTLYAAVALYFVRNDAASVLTLGLAAHVAVLIVLTGFAGLLVKRMIKASVAGSTFEASDSADPVQEALQQSATALQDKADAIKGEP